MSLVQSGGKSGVYACTTASVAGHLTMETVRILQSAGVFLVTVSAGVFLVTVLHCLLSSCPVAVSLLNQEEVEADGRRGAPW